MLQSTSSIPDSSKYTEEEISQLVLFFLRKDYKRPAIRPDIWRSHY